VGTRLPNTQNCPAIEPIYNAPSITAVAQQLQAIGKLTWAINPNNKLALTVIASPTWSGGPGQFSIDPRQGGPQTSGFPAGTYNSSAIQANSSAYDSNLKWSTEFDNKRVLLDTTVGWHHEEDSDWPSDGSQFGQPGLINQPFVTWQRSPGSGTYYHGVEEFEDNPLLRKYCNPKQPGFDASMYTNTLCPVTTGYTSGGPIGPEAHFYNQVYNRYSVNTVLTYLLNFAGHHVIKAGANVEVTTMDQWYGHAGGAKITENADGSILSTDEGFGVLVGPDNPRSAEPLRLKTSSIIAGGFIQDSWSIMDVVTANFGVRYDTQALYNSNGELGMALPNEWSPRVGVIFDPTQSGRAKIYANYARYYENVPLALANDSISGQPSNQPYYQGPGNAGPANCNSVMNPGNCTALPHAPGQGYNGANQPSQYYNRLGATSDAVDPHVQPTTEDDFVAGAEYQLFKDARIGASYQRRWLVRWLEDSSNDGLNTYFLSNPGYGWAQNFPKADRTYDALTVFFQKAFGDDWLAIASYTLSYLRGNIGGLFINGEFDPNHNASFDSKAFTINEEGPLDGDRTHEFKLFGAKDWVINLQNRLTTGLSFRANSGSPINFWAADNIYGPGTLNLLLPRGAGGRTPWIYDVDANIGYRFALDRDKSIAVTIDIYNLANWQGTENVDNRYTLLPGFGQQGGNLAQARVVDPGTGNLRPIYSSDKNPNFLLPANYNNNSNAYQTPRYFKFGIRGTF
jgi:hypothetical protein